MPNAAVTESIKFAGPDADGNFKVIQTKNTVLAYPGEVYTKRAYGQFVAMIRHRPSYRKLDITVVEYKAGGLKETGPDDRTFSEQSGGKVFNDAPL